MEAWDNLPVEFKVKMVFPLEEFRGLSNGDAYRASLALLGVPEYLEQYGDDVEHFSYGVKLPGSSRSLTGCWSLEVTDPEHREWGLSYCFAHSTNGVNFAVPWTDLLRRAIQGNLITLSALGKLSRPVLVAYPLEEGEDEPALYELTEVDAPHARKFRRVLIDGLRERVRRWE